MAQAEDDFTVMTYNVENLFDTIHDAEKRDTEFLPESERRWNRWRYLKKLKEVSKVIAGADILKPCDVVGLCEVENDSVVSQLTERSLLRHMKYEYVMTQSADQRGIDVALLYSPHRFRLLHHESIRAKTSQPTRDVLYACGRMPGGDTLDIFMVHLPSKLGKQEAERNRESIREEILRRTDSIYHRREAATIIIMGDFNDELRGKQMEPYARHGFRDLTEGLEAGSYKYKGEWSFIDHILLRTTQGREAECKVPALPFLMEKDKSAGGKKPRRTYLGTHYHGGVSDHLPVIVRMKP